MAPRIAVATCAIDAAGYKEQRRQHILRSCQAAQVALILILVAYGVAIHADLGS